MYSLGVVSYLPFHVLKYRSLSLELLKVSSNKHVNLKQCCQAKSLVMM